MAKKRNGGQRPYGNKETASAPNGSTRLDIKTFEDVADSEDEFHVNRDKILLEEGPAQKRRRQLREEEQLLEPSDEEVLPVDEDEFSSSAEDELEEAEDESALEANGGLGKGVKGDLQDSDEEDIDAIREDEGEEGWGSSKKDYYDADVIETEADALEEEAEARRLQQSQLQDMTAEDFGFDEAQWLEVDQEGEFDGVKDGVHREVLPKIEITDAMGPKERIVIMQTRYPEFEPLAREFLELQNDYDELDTAAKKAIKRAAFHRSNGTMTLETREQLQRAESLVSLKHRALSAYLGALSMYFALLTSGRKLPDGKTTAMPPEDLRDHAIMETLVQCRDLWERIKDVPHLGFDSEADEVPAIGDHSGNGFKEDEPVFITPTDARSSVHPNTDPTEQLSKHQKKRIRKAERLALAAQEQALAKQKERILQTELSLSTLPDFTKNLTATTPSSTPTTKPHQAPTTTNDDEDDSNSDFGDPTTLTAYESAEKSQRKKSLQFYTSQIAQKSQKRKGAGRDLGGDADLPYRERLRDRQERLQAEAERRGEKAARSSTGGGGGIVERGPG